MNVYAHMPNESKRPSSKCSVSRVSH